MVAHHGHATRLLALAERVVGIAGRLVPGALRGEWEREWRAELWHLHRSLEHRGRPPITGGAAFLLRSVGSVADALQLRLGDAQSWRESFAAAAAGWGAHARSVTVGLLFLSWGLAADALLIAFGYLTVADPRSVWGSLTSGAQVLVLGVAVACAVAMIVASAVAAAHLLGAAGRPVHDSGRVRTAETILVAGVTGWVGRWFAAFGVRTAVAPHQSAWLASADAAGAVAVTWVVSWVSGLAVFAVLRARRPTRRAGLPA